MSDHDKIHEMIITELREVKKDVKSLLALKFQLIGIVTGVSFIVSIGWQFILK